MNDYSSDYMYIKKKTEILETCNCPPRNFCGICFWKGITVGDDHLLKHICTKCKADNESFKERLYEKDVKSINFEPLCGKACIWWDWFHHQRQTLADNMNISFVYKRK